MFLVKWNNGYKGISVPSLLVYKSHLLIIAYGEQFIDTELESNLKQYTVKQEEDKQTCDQLECLLVLALLYCRRGKVCLLLLLLLYTCTCTDMLSCTCTYTCSEPLIISNNDHSCFAVFLL